jgi:ADP-glucose pyrophosphorylase
MRNRYVTDTPQTKEFLEGVLILDTKVNHHVYRKQTLVDKKSTIKPVIVMSSVHIGQGFFQTTQLSK